MYELIDFSARSFDFDLFRDFGRAMVGKFEIGSNRSISFVDCSVVSQESLLLLSLVGRSSRRIVSRDPFAYEYPPGFRRLILRQIPRIMKMIPLNWFRSIFGT